MLTEGTPTRDVACELTVHFIVISYLQCNFRKFARASNRPHNHKARVMMPAHDCHIRCLRPRDHIRSATR